MDPRESGADCDNCPLKDQTPVSPQLVPNARLFILDESPSQSDVSAGKPLTGQPGDLVRDCLTRTNMDSKEVSTSSALLCRTPFKMKSKEWERARKCCAPRLERELTEYPGDVVLAYGARALESLTDLAQITKWMGALLPITRWLGNTRRPGNPVVSEKLVLATIHPGTAVREPPKKTVVLIHTARAIAASKGALTPWEWPRIITGFDGEQAVDAALDELELEGDTVPLGLDTETAGLSYHAELKDVGLASATLALCIQWNTCTPRQLARVKAFVEGPRPKILQNGMFDHFVFRERGVHMANFTHDTQYAAAVITPRLPKDLGFLGSLFSHAPRYKSDFHAISNNPWKSDEKALERAIYCARDAFLTRWLMLNQFLPRLAAEIHKGPEQYADLMAELHIAIKMREYGVYIDRAKLNELRTTLAAQAQSALIDLKAQALALGFEDFNPAAIAHVRRMYVEIFNVRSLSRTGSGLQSFSADELLRFADHSDERIRRFSRTLLTLRRLSKLNATYLRDFDDLIDTDNRVRPNWRPNGAATRRWSCSDPNLQQSAKKREE